MIWDSEEEDDDSFIPSEWSEEDPNTDDDTKVEESVFENVSQREEGKEIDKDYNKVESSGKETEIRKENDMRSPEMETESRSPTATIPVKLGSGGLVEDQIDVIFRLIRIRQDWRGGNSEQVYASSSGLGHQ
ncbi:hypothetical protein L6452_07401 [Arctium lappa]|uniref:Uncharacterized protein n=1 Tax=Arctium lappa TaxID=4217 RepID=A0ACB9EKZ5_ARCLA|nr:hypothetical protein L6452_07401 [Arctium lappa]